MLLEVDPDRASLSRIVLCEDKASVKPRALVTGSIWPEIKLIQANQKDLEILAAVTAILDTMGGVDREAVIEATSWNRVRQFRVSVTAGADQIQNGGYQHIFSGFEEAAAGEIECRMAEVMPVAEVRAYLEDLAERVGGKLREMARNV